MIRVRTETGKAYIMTPSARFVELCNDDGEIAVLVFMKDDGEVQILHPSDSTFRNYVKSYKLKSTGIVNTND